MLVTVQGNKAIPIFKVISVESFFFLNLGYFELHILCTLRKRTGLHFLQDDYKTSMVPCL